MLSNNACTLVNLHCISTAAAAAWAAGGIGESLAQLAVSLAGQSVTFCWPGRAAAGVRA